MVSFVCMNNDRREVTITTLQLIGGLNRETSINILEASNWQLDQAIELLRNLPLNTYLPENDNELPVHRRNNHNINNQRNIINQFFWLIYQKILNFIPQSTTLNQFDSNKFENNLRIYGPVAKLFNV